MEPLSSIITDSMGEAIAKAATMTPPSEPDFPALQQSIVDTAASYIGKQEKAGNMGFKDPAFEDKMIEVGFRDGHAWCCYFAELVWKEGFSKAGLDMFDILDNLFSASTQTTWRNFKNSGQGFSIEKDPQPGDLAIWQSNTEPTTGHIAIVVSGLDDNNNFQTVEGNTNDKGGREGYIVAAKQRPCTFDKNKKLVLLGFVHYEA